MLFEALSPYHYHCYQCYFWPYRPLTITVINVTRALTLPWRRAFNPSPVPCRCSDRIMVTLSCFIVVATLFSQVAATTPSSASNKVIDTIFFWVMTRLFFIFLHHFSQSFMWAYVGRRREAGKAGVTGAPRASPEGGGGPPGGVLGGEKGASALAWAPPPLPAPTKADEAHARRVRRVRRVNRAIILAMVAWDALATLVMAHDIVIRRQKAGDQFGECREFE